MSVLSRTVVVSLAASFVALSACAVDPTAGSVASGPVGALGTTCECTNGQPDCDAATSGCQSGLRCTAQDVGGASVCTRDCPCPFGYVCKGAGIPGRLACFSSAF